MQVSEFLERSHLFSQEDVRLKIYEMDFPFRSGTVFFRGDELEDFRSHIILIIKRYMRISADQIVKSDPKEKILNRVWDGIFSFNDEFNLVEIFKKISSGRDYFDIPIDMNNSQLRVRRFGNCLGLNVLQNEEIHKTGFDVMTRMCNERSPVVAPFIHRIECSIPMPKKHGIENSVDVNFEEVFANIYDVCSGFEWKSPREWLPDFISQYISANTDNEKWVTIGNQNGIEIKAAITHSKGGPDFKRSSQWRRGNITVNNSENPTLGNFVSGGDLRLLLVAHSGLLNCNFLTPFNTDLNLAQLQYYLRVAGATLFTQLCCASALDSTGRTSAYL